MVTVVPDSPAIVVVDSRRHPYGVNNVDGGGFGEGRGWRRKKVGRRIEEASGGKKGRGE